MDTITETVTLPYTQAPETSTSLDWADLVTLDLSKFDRPGGKQELATELSQAIEEIGPYKPSIYDFQIHEIPIGSRKSFLISS